MKSILLFIALVVSGLFLPGQNQFSLSSGETNPYGQADTRPYIFLSEVQVEGFDLIAQSLTDTIRITDRGDIFQVVSEFTTDDGKWIIIRFWDFAGSRRSREWVSQADNGRFFALPIKDFNTRCRPYPRTSSLSMGVLMIPVKLRLPAGERSSLDFSKDMAMAMSVGFRHGISRFRPYYVSFLASAGASTITALPQNTGSFTNDPLELASVTGITGMLLDLDGVQLGVFAGLDMVPNTPGKHWIYQNQPWISFGIGYQFLSWNKDLGRPGSND